ncbi:gamma-glutamylcyclotransferase [Spirosoma sp. KNUC1025]|uniref:gamma-glutamylcyclotransferase family protein n=1 Tax=Spirosoma sp. KNUC1025 TaxID=2894082 RepID=UPI003867BB26|nr:gamma-glutamylcyclotransferase [Spirosoma sp. KNUC1025]
MALDSDYLIVYGTLRPSFENPFARYLRQHSQYVGEVTFPGQLVDLGNYPGALFLPDSPTTVYASLYNIHQHKNELLAYLDEYESIGEQFEQPHEYVRALIPVSYSGTIFDCWVYLYQLPIDPNRLIESGDYERYLGRQGA